MKNMPARYWWTFRVVRSIDQIIETYSTNHVRHFDSISIKLRYFNFCCLINNMRFISYMRLPKIAIAVWIYMDCVWMQYMRWTTHIKWTYIAVDTLLKTNMHFCSYYVFKAYLKQDNFKRFVQDFEISADNFFCFKNDIKLW